MYLRDRIVNVQLPSSHQFPLQCFHCIARVADVVVRNHNETSMLALRVHAANRPERLHQLTAFYKKMLPQRGPVALRRQGWS